MAGGPWLMRKAGLGSPGAACTLACAVYSSNWPRDNGNFTSTVFTAKPPRNTHFVRGCHARPRRGWKLLLSRLLSALFGCTKAPFRPVTSSVALGSQLVIFPYLVLKGLSLE